MSSKKRAKVSSMRLDGRKKDAQKIMTCPFDVCWLSQQVRQIGPCEWAIKREGEADCGYG